MIKQVILSIALLATFSFNSVAAQTYENSAVLPVKMAVSNEKTDEFISYYKFDFRLDENGQIIPICDITYASYTVMYGKYATLNKDERETVNLTPDYEEGFTIGDSIKTLVNQFNDRSNQSVPTKRVLNKSTTIIIIVVVAVFGMSTIFIFYILKNNKIIS